MTLGAVTEVLFAGNYYRVKETAYNEGMPKWYKILMPSGLAWVRAEEVATISFKKESV